MDDDTVRITRFPKGADQNVKRAFAQTLVQALDDLKVEPGDEFVIARYQGELEPETEVEVEPDSGLPYKALLEAERGERFESACDVLLGLYDFRLGLIDTGDLFKRIRVALQREILADDMTDGLHGELGLGNTGQLIERGG